MICLAWDAQGERLALATGLPNPDTSAGDTAPGPGCPAPAPAGQLLLAAVRRAHAWAYSGAGACSGAGTAARCGVAGAGGTLVYAYRSAARAGTCVAFWDTRSGERRVKTVRRLLAIMVCRPMRAACLCNGSAGPTVLTASNEAHHRGIWTRTLSVVCCVLPASIM